MKNCKLCKTKFEPKHGNQKFCSDKCFHIFYGAYRKDWKAEHTEIETDYVRNGARAYNNIKARCTNPNHPQYHNYGARGLTLELTKEEFLAIYFSTDTCELCGCRLNDNNRNASDGRTLDRIDQSRGYEKGNLRLLCRSCNASLAYKRRKNRL